MRLTLLAFLILVPYALGQRASFGFVGGANLTNDFPLYRTQFPDPNYPEGPLTFDIFGNSHTFIAGFSAEVHFTDRLSVEGNGLYRNLRLQRKLIAPDGSLLSTGHTDIGTWEWPILFKYRLEENGAYRPFLEVGPSFRTRHGQVAAEPSQIGGTVGAGIEFNVGRFRVSPALRYTRWQRDRESAGYPAKQDQVEFVTGFSFATSVPSWSVAGRKLRFGLIGGVPLTNGIEQPQPPARIDEEQGYIAGIALEWELNPRWSIEANALYRPFRAFDVFNSPQFGEFRNEFTVLTWQILILAKYHFEPDARFQPILEAGPSFRLSGNRNGYEPFPFGLTAGAGIETFYKAMKIGPVLRYTRWGPDQERRGTQPDQVELLVSFTF